MKLDNYDFRLLGLLEEDARMPLTKMAKKMYSSQQVVSYRLKALESKGVIEEYYTLLDISKIGYTSYRTLVRLSNVDSKKKEEIINYLMACGNILWLVDIGGRWDLLINFLAKNIVQFNTFFEEFKSQFPNQVQNYDILTTLGGINFGRDYFTKQRRTISSVHKFGIEEVEKDKNMDEIDFKILSILSRNARENAVKISEKLKVAPNTVILRIKSLKKKGIIQGYKPLIHLDKIGFNGYKALIKFQNITKHRENELISFIKTYPAVVGVLKFVGNWDLEIEFEVDSQEKMLELGRKIRDEFQDIINDFEIFPLYHEYKYDFFPSDLSV